MEHLQNKLFSANSLHSSGSNLTIHIDSNQVNYANNFIKFKSIPHIKEAIVDYNSNYEFIHASPFEQYSSINVEITHAKYKNINLPILTLEANRKLKCLSKRESEIATEVANGKTTVEIAKSLFISRRTVEVHRAKIFNKLKIKSVARLAQLVLLSNIYLSFNE
ncbi:LuxR C-terminal-related transcriptional regulator [Shewanella sp. TC10]|uniref:LuxR C-terminal-related transcriptional regulator n=1 Tax=Shewanella sp. TC10 TaxID=1419739 RepID=UPI00129E5E55|nr:helix-turn-helix transcriptional regulator [Shewanella sp. TC10]